MESETLLQEEGLGFSGRADMKLASLFELLQGGRTLRQAVAAMAQNLGVGEQDLYGPVLDAVVKLLRTAHLHEK
jgi:hypothetical protein